MGLRYSKCSPVAGEAIPSPSVAPRPSIAPRPSLAPLPSVAPLSNLPAEIVLLISSHLTVDPTALVALALTCKPLYNIITVERANLQGAHRENLLLLLEKDLGDKVFYCPYCSRLHSFLSSESPTNYDFILYRLVQGCPYWRSVSRGQAFEVRNGQMYNL